jgi:hypothetical protein
VLEGDLAELMERRRAHGEDRHRHGSFQVYLSQWSG